MKTLKRTVTVVDKDFLKMFNIEFVEGDINSALNEPRSIILTEEMASKYFGNEDALGKTMSSLGFDLTRYRCCKEIAGEYPFHI